MATLNLNEKKIPSAENLRLIAQLCISLANKQSSLEDKCIKPWKANGETYIKDISYVSHGGYIYLCSVSNNDTDFTESHWTKLTDSFIEITKDDVAALINLSPEEISKLSDLISTEIRLDKTFSSSDTYTRIQAAIDTAKEYTNNQLGKAVKPAYKVVASTSEVTETGYFYLISNGTNYDMYVLSSDGAVVSLGTSDVDLSNYYTKTEVDNDFLKKTDATSTYATITTVDGKVDKTSIATSLGDTVTDEQVTSALLTKTEFGKINESMGSTDISAIGDGTVTGAVSTVNSNLGEKVDYKVVVEDGTRYVEDIVVQDINTWLPNNNSSIVINLKKVNGVNYSNFQLLCNKQDSKNWTCIVIGGISTFWRICYVNGVRYIEELATMDKVVNSIIRESKSVLYNLNNVDNIEVAIDIAKSGYKPIAVSLFNAGTHLWFAQGIYFDDTVCNLSLRGVTLSSATNAKCEVLVTYIKTS